jgi:IclR family acetate operon transcriptional repressor
MSTLSKGRELDVGGAADGPSRSVVRAINLLKVVALQARQPVRLTDVVQMTGLPKTTCHRLLNVLCDEGLLRIDDYGRFAPGPLLLAMGMNFIGQADVREIAHPAMVEFTQLTGETTHLGVLHFPMVVYIDKVESPHAVRMHSQIGAVNPVYRTGLGKALIAFSSEELIAEVCAGPLEATTRNTITDGEALRADLILTRERGYSVDDVENEAGIRCIGAPILGHDGRPIAAVSLAGPDVRLTLKVAHELGPSLVAVTREISRQLGYRGTSGTSV